MKKGEIYRVAGTLLFVGRWLTGGENDRLEGQDGNNQRPVE